jgi:hypothetical protein
MRGAVESRFTWTVALADFLGGKDCPEILMSSTSGNALPELSTLNPWTINPFRVRQFTITIESKVAVTRIQQGVCLGIFDDKEPIPVNGQVPGNEVDWKAPWVNTDETLPTNTPRPICSVPPVPESALKMSEKLPRLSLKPWY